MDSNSTVSSDDEADPSLLHTAVKLGDLIRQTVKEHPPPPPSSQESPSSSSSSSSSSNNNSSKGLVETFINPSATSTTPGLLEGLVAAAMTAGLLTPIRSRLIRATARTPMGVFVDLLASSTLVIGATMSGMYVGGLTGSAIYLNRLAVVPTEGTSPTADAICQSKMMQKLLLQQTNSGSEQMSFSILGDRDPRHQAIKAYQKALQKCRDRSAYQQQDQSVLF